MGFGFLSHLFYPWGLIAQGLALVHFIRRRPDSYWLYIILFLGPLGAAIYFIAEVVPDVGIVGQGFKMFPRRKRIGELRQLVQVNPSPGNFEELGDLLMEDGKLGAAREAFDRAIGSRGDSLDAFYRRGVCALMLGDVAAAVPDLAKVYAKEPGYDFFRCAGLLAQAYALTGEKERAAGLFRWATDRSVTSETYLNYSDLLASEGRNAEAREWAQKVLEKKPAMPGYQKRRERKWFRGASARLKRMQG